MNIGLARESTSNASLGIDFPKFTSTIDELLSAPISYLEIVIAYVGAAATKIDRYEPDHPGHGLSVRADQDPVPAVDDRVPAADGGDFLTVRFIIDIWAKGFEQLQFIPMLIVTPMTVLGGAFYSIDMLPPVWRTVTCSILWSI